MSRFHTAALIALTLLLLAGCATSGVSPAQPTPDDVTAAPTGDGLLPVTTPPNSLLLSDWRTDFSQRTVEWTEIRSGGPPKDGIPAIDAPTFERVDAARAWLSDRDPVILFGHDDDARAYPLAILIWHEIVNDQVGDLPVTVTFCPLCNASIVFDRRVDDQVLDFGTTGLLRNSDLVMYDRQSESWWQQFTGTGIVGARAGTQLTVLTSQVISFGDFAAAFPDAQVLARPSTPRAYGSNPYMGYDSASGRPFLFTGKLDPRLGPVERIVGVAIGDVVMAYPYRVVADAGVIDDEVGGTSLVVFYKPGMASALDTNVIAEGRDVGSAAVFDRRVGDRVLTFAAAGNGAFRDTETDSTWNILGQATAGELAGTQLTRLSAYDHFWFAWSAFFPDTALYTAQ